MVLALAGDSTMTRRRPFTDIAAPLLSIVLSVFDRRVRVVFLGMLILLMAPSGAVANDDDSVVLLQRRREIRGAFLTFQPRNDS